MWKSTVKLDHDFYGKINIFWVLVNYTKGTNTPTHTPSYICKIHQASNCHQASYRHQSIFVFTFFLQQKYKISRTLFRSRIFKALFNFTKFLVTWCHENLCEKWVTVNFLCFNFTKFSLNKKAKVSKHSLI